jgi:hypothetical protein
MPMQYFQTPIPDSSVPRAALPWVQHMLDTYASETNKLVSVWRAFEEDDLGYRRTNGRARPNRRRHVERRRSDARNRRGWPG